MDESILDVRCDDCGVKNIYRDILGCFPCIRLSGSQVHNIRIITALCCVGGASYWRRFGQPREHTRGSPDLRTVDK